MGFAGLTGSSTKALADLAHYGLIEKAGKGALRVSQRAVDILYPASSAGKTFALREAAFAPALFGALHKHFHDGTPSENALKGYLIRQQFVSAAIPYVVTSYMETCRLVQQEGATESHGKPGFNDEDSAVDASESAPASERIEPLFKAADTLSAKASTPADKRTEGLQMMTGERELTTGMLSKGASFRLIVSGQVGEKEIERLIRKLALDKEILADANEVFDVEGL